MEKQKQFKFTIREYFQHRNISNYIKLEKNSDARNVNLLLDAFKLITKYTEILFRMLKQF